MNPKGHFLPATATGASTFPAALEKGIGQHDKGFVHLFPLFLVQIKGEQQGTGQPFRFPVIPAAGGKKGKQAKNGSKLQKMTAWSEHLAPLRSPLVLLFHFLPGFHSGFIRRFLIYFFPPRPAWRIR